MNELPCCDNCQENKTVANVLDKPNVYYCWNCEIYFKKYLRQKEVKP